MYSLFQYTICGYSVNYKRLLVKIIKIIVIMRVIHSVSYIK